MGNTITLPAGMGKYYSYMNYDKITAKSSNQYQLRETARSKGDLTYTANGYAKINGRYVVALTNTFGNVGDYVDIRTADGTTINAVIGDIKNQADSGANKWGHNDGQVVVEYITNWNDHHSNPTGNGGVVSITNTGNYNTSDSSDTPWYDIPGKIEDKKNEILTKVISFIVLLFIGVVGVWYFLKAFNIDLKKAVL